MRMGSELHDMRSNSRQRLPGLCPHTCAVGSAFEYEFDLPALVNPVHQPKPAARTKQRPAPANKQSAGKPARQPKAVSTSKPKRVKLTPEERNERARARAPQHASNGRATASAETVATLPSSAELPAPIVLINPGDHGNADLTKLQHQPENAAVPATKPSFPTDGSPQPA
jgi:hypothetical protein